MCQLLGVISNKEVNIEYSLREFRHRGDINRHGWGFAFSKGTEWILKKQPSSLANENLNNKDFKFKSKIIIGHVRLASCGNLCHENTHPFVINNWAFAHNGTVLEIKDFPLKRYLPKGKTDSEHAFCYLLERIEESHSNKEKILKDEAEKIRKMGRFNFLLSNGKILYAYGDDALYYVERKSPFSFARLKDDDYEVHLSDIKAPNEKAVIVATEPLTTNEDWIKIYGLKIFEMV